MSTSPPAEAGRGSCTLRLPQGAWRATFNPPPKTPPPASADSPRKTPMEPRLLSRRPFALLLAGLLAAVGQQQIDQDKAAVEEAEARIKVAEASLASAKLNLSFTQVRAPIGGRISRYYYTPGNLVTQDQTLLTTIVTTDPMYAYFDVEERTFDRLVAGLNAARAASPGARPELPVLMALEGEDGYPHRGRLDFINNQVNPSTGTVAVRGVFTNDRTDGGLWSLVPGRFVRVRLPLGEPHRAQLVIDRAIGSDQGLKFVYTLGPENKVQYRRVKTGSLQEDGLRAIEPYRPAGGKE